MNQAARRRPVLVLVQHFQADRGIPVQELHKLASLIITERAVGEDQKGGRKGQEEMEYGKPVADERYSEALLEYLRTTDGRGEENPNDSRGGRGGERRI